MSEPGGGQHLGSPRRSPSSLAPPFPIGVETQRASKRAVHAGSPKQILCGGQNETTKLLGTWNSLLSSNRVSAMVTGQEDSALETHRASLKHLRMLRSGALAQVQLTAGRNFKGLPLLEPIAMKLWACERSHRPPTFSTSVYLPEPRGRAHYTAFETYVRACKGFCVGGCVSGCIRGSECAGQVCGDAGSGGWASHRVTGPGHSQFLCLGLISSHLKGMPTCIS